MIAFQEYSGGQKWKTGAVVWVVSLSTLGEEWVNNWGERGNSQKRQCCWKQRGNKIPLLKSMLSSIKPFPLFILTDYVTAHNTDDHNDIFWPCIMTTRLLALFLGMASSGDNHISQTHTLKALVKEQKTRSPRGGLLWGEYLHHKFHGGCRRHRGKDWKILCLVAQLSAPCSDTRALPIEITAVWAVRTLKRTFLPIPQAVAKIFFMLLERQGASPA